MNKVLVISIPLLVVIITITLLWSYRYEIGIQKMPVDFSTDEGEVMVTYYSDGDNYYKSLGEYVFGAEKMPVSKSDYITAYKLMLKKGITVIQLNE